MTRRSLAPLLLVALVAAVAVAVAHAHNPTSKRTFTEGPGAERPVSRTMDALVPTPRGDGHEGVLSPAGSRPSASAHTLEWWRARARTNRRLYRAEHHRWRQEKNHRLRATRRLARSLQTHHAHAREDWRARQIAAAEVIAREAVIDPWPNCPDPYDGSGASWDDTVACENYGNWLDTPGDYRCGLQFEPMWERRFGRLCP